MKDSSSSPPFWLWLNLLSLDAPLIAIVWQDFLARCFPSLLREPGRWALGLTVWAIYLADRLIDVRHPEAPVEPPRHRFYRRNRTLVPRALLAVALITDCLVVVFWRCDHPSSRMDCGWPQPLSSCIWLDSLFYVLVEERGRSRRPRSCSRSASSSSPGPGQPVNPWRDSSRTSSSSLLRPVLRQSCADRRMGTGYCAFTHLDLLLVLGLGCAALGNSRWYWAVAASAVGLAALDLARGSLSVNARRVLADAVLLTPVLLR